MFVIGEVIVEDSIATERFVCDLAACKGACCTLHGGRGAPLQDDEVLEIRKAYPAASKYLSALNRQIVESSGASEGEPGWFATRCIDDRDCVLVYYEEGIARCSLERAFLDGSTDWRKPVSCHLFPIRVGRGAESIMRYEQIKECLPGRKKGEKERVPIADFLRDPLVRRFGRKWYDAFHAECNRKDLPGDAR